MKGALYTHHESAGKSRDRISTVYSSSKVRCRVWTPHSLWWEDDIMRNGQSIWSQSILSLITDVLDIELLFLQFLRSQREQKYISYSQSLAKIIPWMFALDHYHYARWLTVHVNDLISMENNNPLTHAEFLTGSFVTQTTRRKFSSLAHDQVHEQLNAIVKWWWHHRHNRKWSCSYSVDC